MLGRQVHPYPMGTMQRSTITFMVSRAQLPSLIRSSRPRLESRRQGHRALKDLSLLWAELLTLAPGTS